MIYKLVAGVIQYFCFPEKPMNGGDILDFLLRGNLRKGGFYLQIGGGGYDPPTNHVHSHPPKMLGPP